ncbi:Rrf2 family transcriptional regulator [Parapedobacter sp. SGR-10]|uniref:RrF2 family transcriptional regulator n=1 Tax=Parapedobacter sp. SGR-10 TaxID=2710879 RepID=UPI0013D81793|nr:Rrf2 family transcriptional regulator [Parapedobacter sp. SGR-10]NGF56822.1 Rrf2 family transcriptional regulator [Parapedobacter sp. SGR-10]
MGIFSKTCEYALRAVFYIAQSSHEGRRVGIIEIAEKIKSPQAFLGKILQQLSREGIILSAKGPNGGFFMDGVGLKRPLADVVEAIDGKDIFIGCGLGLDHCSEKEPCPLHHEFKLIRNKISVMLKETSIGQFNQELLLGKLSLYKRTSLE